MSPEQEYVLRTVEERGVRLIRLWFTDVLGQLKSVAISPAELEQVFNEGVQFDGTAIDGFSRVHEADVLARPDATTFELLPWAKADEPSGRMFCNIESLDDTPFEGDPRQILQRNLAAAREKGYTFFAAPEAEFFYFESGETEGGAPKPIDHASYFDLTTADVSSDLRKTTIHMLEAMGIPVEYSFHEDSPSQHEIDLRYTEALSMADNIMTLRLVVKKIAMDRGVYATFMPKPLNGVQGSGMHTHLRSSRARPTPSTTPTMRGPLRRRQAVHRRCAQARSGDHRRHQPVGQQLQAPRRDLRGAAVCCLGPQQPLGHDPGAGPQEGQARIGPHRVPGARRCRQPVPRLLADPAAGLRGIDEGYELPRDRRQPLRTLRQRASHPWGRAAPPFAQRGARRDGGVQARPRNLGEHVFEWFLRNKRAEWAEFQSKVTPFELERYLGNW